MNSVQLSSNQIQRIESFLRRKGIEVTNMESFTFMTRYDLSTSIKCKPQFRNLAGPGVFTFRLKSGALRAFKLYPYRLRYRYLIQYLIEKKIPFINYVSQEKRDMDFCYIEFPGFSMRLAYFTVLALILTFSSIFLFLHQPLSVAIFGVVYLLLGVCLLYHGVLKQHSLILDAHNLILRNYFQKKVIPYHELKKVNFGGKKYYKNVHPFFMEVLDVQNNYHVFFLGNINKRNVISAVECLKAHGIDATSEAII